MSCFHIELEFCNVDFYEERNAGEKNLGTRTNKTTTTKNNNNNKLNPHMNPSPGFNIAGHIEKRSEWFHYCAISTELNRVTQ